MTGTFPRIVIAGAESGVGKTSVTLGLVRALRRRGLAVQPFKVGPDFLDPTYLRLAAGRQCYNLDPWMCGEDYVQALFARASADADVAVVEGVMGMYDGASPESSEGSTAAVASLLEAPVLLLANAGGVARSFAALVKGYAEFEPHPQVAGVVVNRVGSRRHAEMLAAALESTGAPPLLGAFSSGSLPELADRHLGLVTADGKVLPSETITQFADACERHLDVERLLELARGARPHPGPLPGGEGNKRPHPNHLPAGEGNGGPHPDSPPEGNLPSPREGIKGREAILSELRLGVARDDAFHFYYPDNLEAFEARGARLAEFSPTADGEVPEVDALYLGGGYPEEFADQLSANAGMRRSVREFCGSGRPVYAECGGLMYLSESLRTTGGGELPMVGALPAGVRMLPRRRALGYAEVTLTADCLLGPKGSRIRGHEFHYSELLRDPAEGEGWSAAYSVRKRRAARPAPEGYRCGNVLASYVHLHLASRPEAIEHFLTICRETK